MKLRYTPFQIKCFAVEEQESIYHDKIKSFKSLDNDIVLVGSLHSMLAPVASMIKWLRPNTSINYIMTDSGALPIDFSFTVKSLKEKGIIDNTITIGHAFGGDFECINIYTGLITAKEVIKSDITIVCMGPGIVGTGTKYGFSGIEQGYILNAVSILKGSGFAIPRISFSDKRDRHRGISHHTITALSETTLSRCNVVLPILTKNKNSFIETQLDQTEIRNKHNIIYEDGANIINALNHFKLNVTTMGRGYNDDTDYFISLGAVGKAAVNYLDGLQ